MRLPPMVGGVMAGRPVPPPPSVQVDTGASSQPPDGNLPDSPNDGNGLPRQ
jgi:hypothetical protein